MGLFGFGKKKKAEKTAAPSESKREAAVQKQPEPESEEVLSDDPEVLFQEAVNIHKTDKVKYHRLIERAAELGHVWSQRLNGSCYSRGEGCAKDPEKALFWFEKAAQNGDADAQEQCGTMYEQGWGCEKNPETALQWYIKAAEQGYATSQFVCGNCYEEGKCNRKKDPEKALEWYKKAAQQGHVDAQIALARVSVMHNEDEARYWLNHAAAQGSDRAKEFLTALDKKGK